MTTTKMLTVNQFASIYDALDWLECSDSEDPVMNANQHDQYMVDAAAWIYVTNLHKSTGTYGRFVDSVARELKFPLMVAISVLKDDGLYAPKKGEPESRFQQLLREEHPEVEDQIEWVDSIDWSAE
jgi:hypothetical protein